MNKHPKSLFYLCVTIRTKNKMKPGKNMISFSPRNKRNSFSAKHAHGFGPGNTICT